MDWATRKGKKVAPGLALVRDPQITLSWVAERSQNLVSHHVRALRVAGLARSRREGKMVLYSLTEEGDRLLAALLAESQPAV